MILIIYKAFIFLGFYFLHSTQFSEINHISLLKKKSPQPSQPQSNMGSEELFIRSYIKEFWGQNPETLSEEEMDVVKNRYTSHWNISRLSQDWLTAPGKLVAFLFYAFALLAFSFVCSNIFLSRPWYEAY
jgi:hypothetical protein